MLTALRDRLGRRLSWRLLAVFVGATLVPLAASDWIATTVVSDVAQGLSRDRDAIAARAASRQVFDRLALSATLLRAIAEARDEGRTQLFREAVGTGAAFEALACRDGDFAAWSALRGRWNAAAEPGAPRLAKSTALRLEPHADGRAALLMAPAASLEPACIGVLDPARAWEPLVDSRDDAAWRVQADDGRAVYALRGPDAAGTSVATEHFTTHLFLAAEFGAANWTFEQVAPRATGRWHGMPIVAWLLSVAAATLLLIGLVVSRTLARALRPLDALDEGARRLAQGVESTRVDVGRNDELGRLADSFNDMAAQLQQRHAAARALGAIDEGILAHVAFADLAGLARRRLAEASPASRAVVAWRADDGLLNALDGAQKDAVAISGPPEALAQFDAVVDGPFETAQQADLAAALGLDDELAWRAWSARDGGRNRALVLVGGPVDGSEAAALRDRLTVAVVARDREMQLQQRATHDLLTGLRNTWGLQTALAPLLDADTPLAVLFVDLDHFKDVNDCYGHAIGDRLLQSAARRLARAAPADALISRNGGDEFVVILPNGSAAQAATAAAALLASLRQPFILSTTEHRSSASIGIALFPEHGLDRDDLLRCADIALYESKNAGRDRATLFEPAFDARLRERNDLLTGLERGLRLGEFVVHYQPRFEASSGRFASAEALVRWRHPERGLLLPGVFIDLAETSGLIDALGRAVMAATIEQLGQWRRDGLVVGRVSVNVSQRQFESGTLVPLVRDLLERHGVPGRQLEIEVTESVLGGDVESVRRQLHELRALGASVAMDDFGTGYSSMAQLRTLPIDVMKIDRAFVRDLETAPDAVAIARTIVTLARALGLRIVAEGIETPAQAAVLRELGCDEFQGFLFARALPAAALEALARTPPHPVAT